MGSLHSPTLWAIYFLAQLMHVLSKANAEVRSKNNGVTSLRQYFSLRWIPLASRTLLCTAAFVFIWENPKLMGLEALAVTPSIRMALAYFFGWFSDSVLEHAAALIPGAQKDLPSVSDADAK